MAPFDIQEPPFKPKREREFERKRERVQEEKKFSWRTRLRRLVSANECKVYPVNYNLQLNSEEMKINLFSAAIFVRQPLSCLGINWIKMHTRIKIEEEQAPAAGGFRKKVQT